jgi:ankyrin repeat protein
MTSPLKEPPALNRTYAWFSALVAEDIALMADLLAHGLPVDCLHPLRHTTGLMEATRLNRLSQVQWLLERGAAPTLLCGLPRGTPLHLALKRRLWDIANCLAEASPHVSAIDSYGRTGLHLLSMEALSECDHAPATAVAGRLLEKGCPLDALDHEGVTALHYCVIHENTRLCELFLRQGANPNIQTPDARMTPLAIAALEQNSDIAKLLLAHGANPNLPTRDGSTPATLYPPIARLTSQVRSAKNARAVERLMAEE